MTTQCNATEMAKIAALAREGAVDVARETAETLIKEAAELGLYVVELRKQEKIPFVRYAEDLESYFKEREFKVTIEKTYVSVTW